MHGREHLVGVRPLGRGLALYILRYAYVVPELHHENLGHGWQYPKLRPTSPRVSNSHATQQPTRRMATSCPLKNLTPFGLIPKFSHRGVA
jgi:hypothetical protein